jgi:hypothetical protein
MLASKPTPMAKMGICSARLACLIVCTISFWDYASQKSDF